jgi:sodium/hydrogen exchanger-like protein 6/7
VFSISLMIGTIIGLIAALALKRTNIHLYPGLESCLIALMAYASYFLSNSVHLSGMSLARLKVRWCLVGL